MGPVEVVAKKFEDLNSDVCYIGQSAGSRVFDNDPCKYLEWLIRQTNVTTEIVKKHISPTKACYSEFVSESLCHLLLTDLVSSGITPHVVMAFRALKHKHDGYLIQERISSNIDEALEENPELTCRDICGMYLQVFVTLHTLQQACGFKHHDLHLDNVFLKRIDGSMTWNGVKLKDATHFSYKLDDHVLTIPNCGYIVKIGDFGMSSLNIYGRRIQMLCYKSSPVWGEFSADLDGGRGYDGQVLMGDVPFDLGSWRVHDADTRAFLQRIRVAAQGPNGKLTHEKQRPAIGHVSDVPPLDVVKQVFLTDPQPVYDFRTPPTDATVVCLTSL
jgi:serine/threonine protein kinase